MEQRRILSFCGALCGIIITSALAHPLHAQTVGQPEILTAGAIDINSGRTGTVKISIDHWATADERRALTDALLEKGQDHLLEILQGMKSIGRISTPDSIGYELRYAQERRSADGGRDIVLATDRPINYWEAINRPGPADYPLTIVQIHFNKDGKGEGKLSVAARVTGDTRENKMLEIENYQLQPVSLVEVQSEKRD